MSVGNCIFLTEVSVLSDTFYIFAEINDFKVDGKYTFEVGGADKGFSQIAGVKESYVLADDIESPSGRKIPLWMLGFIY